MSDRQRTRDETDVSPLPEPLTLVPKVGVYRHSAGKGDLEAPELGMTSNVFHNPGVLGDERSLGVWRSYQALLQAQCAGDDSGPASGINQKYENKELVWARTTICLTGRALLGAVRGQTAWGKSGDGSGRVVLWRWELEDIDEIVAHRIRKYMKVWDVGILIRSHTPEAMFEHSGLGKESGPFGSFDADAKAARVEKSDVLGFASLLAATAAAATGRTIQRTTETEGKETEDYFRLV